MPYHIFRLGADQWARGKSIRLQALEGSPDAFGSTLEEELTFGEPRWKTRFARADAATFVASCGDDDIGLATGAPYDSDVGLYSMWVSPSARGTGVGGDLVDAVVEWAIAQGHTRMLLDVGNFNEPAIALYQSRGFVPTGVAGTLPPPREHIEEHQREKPLTEGA